MHRLPAGCAGPWLECCYHCCLDGGPARIQTAVADAWVDESSPSTNLGSDSILKVRSQGPSGNFRALVRFPTPETAPGGCVLWTATLRLSAASPGEDWTLQAMRLASAWTESSVRWDNQPATEGAASSIASGSDQGYREWRVTAQVAVGAPDRPQLAVTFTPID